MRFGRAYRSKQKNDDKKYLLIIEEINRANVASVFGDVFQLLDRKNGQSEYSITTSEDIRKYLNEVFSEDSWYNQLSSEQQEQHISTMSLYSNMYI